MQSAKSKVQRERRGYPRPNYALRIANCELRIAHYLTPSEGLKHIVRHKDTEHISLPYPLWGQVLMNSE